MRNAPPSPPRPLLRCSTVLLLLLLLVLPFLAILLSALGRQHHHALPNLAPTPACSDWPGRCQHSAAAAPTHLPPLVNSADGSVMQLLRAAMATSSASATRRLGSRLSPPAASAAVTLSLGGHARSSRLLPLVPSSSSSSASSSSSSRRLLSVGAALIAATAGGVPWSRAAGAVAGQPAANRAMATPAAAAAPGGSTSPDTGVLVVYVTAPSNEVGESLAQSLVKSSLAACVNILPGVTSVYRWQGKLEKDAEVLLVIKTTAELLPTLTAKVKELHPYDEPEVVALPVVGGSEGYLSWVKDSTAAAIK